LTAGGGISFRDVVRPHAWVLAFDTSEDFGSVAVARVERDGSLNDVSLRGIEDRRQQVSLLVPTIEAALGDAGVTRGDLSAVVVGSGPGSFTGVRVAASTAKGLVFGSNTPLWTLSSLLGAALDPGWGDETWGARAVAFDARSDRVYAAIFAFQPDEPPQTVIAPRATTIDAFAKHVGRVSAVIAGSAARRHRDRASVVALDVREAPAGNPSAVGLIRALALDPERRAADNPRDFEPTYLRGSSAEPPKPR